MLRLWFKDGSYLICNDSELHWYEMDPELDHVEISIEEEGEFYREENGKFVRV